jgi:hypothetical protein
LAGKECYAIIVEAKNPTKKAGVFHRPLNGDQLIWIA